MHTSTTGDTHVRRDGTTVGVIHGIITTMETTTITPTTTQPMLMGTMDQELAEVRVAAKEVD